METIVKIKCNKCGEEHSRYYHCDLDQQRKEELKQLDIDDIWNDEYRCTGRTTRLADYYVQQLLNNPNKEIEIKDHCDTIKNNIHLTQRILHRIFEEFKGIKIRVTNQNTLKYELLHK